MPNLKKIESSEVINKPKMNFSNKQKLALYLIGVFMVGFLGGIAGIYFLIHQGYLAKNTNLGLVTKETLTVDENSATIDAVNKVSPAVVSIVSTSEVPNLFGGTSTQEGGGSGFIITSDGLIFTNKHVVSDTTATYKVFTADGKSYPAKIQSTDPLEDMAVIKIDAKDLPVVQLGNSDDLKIGQRVIAIGNALGLENSVTAGIISAKDRSIQASSPFGQTAEELQGLLQTDAPINPGNSGGPLVNLEGQVVGINTAVAEGSQSVGFAIPINDAKTAITSVEKSGTIIRPYLGVRYISVTPDIANFNNLSVKEGALIYAQGGAAVISGSPADKIGLKSGDIITAINGEPIDQDHSLRRRLTQYQPNDEIEITYIRDGKENKVKVKLGELK
jgi:serine protease Do